METLECIPSVTKGRNHYQNGKKRSRDVQVRSGKSPGVTAEDEELVEVHSGTRNGLPVLRDITNSRFLEEEGKSRSWNHRRKNEDARERWKILAKALLKFRKNSSKSSKVTNISVRRFSTFDLITPCLLDKSEKVDGSWSKYSTKIRDEVYEIEIRHLEPKLTPEELMGFNNTGNICIWPSEEVMAFLVLEIKGLFESRRILEVGGGMSCLAGLMLAKHGKVEKVDLTDGNLMSVNNVRENIWRNGLEGVAEAFPLDWADHRRLTTKYDIVLSSDCLFFDETRSDLVKTIWNSLKEDGLALVMAPRRGNTLDSFAVLAKSVGFSCTFQRSYSFTVWKRHLKFKECNIEYEEDLHYPILLLLTKQNSLFPFLRQAPKISTTCDLPLWLKSFE